MVYNRKRLIYRIVVFGCLLFIGSIPAFFSHHVGAMSDQPLTFRELTADEIVLEMGAGWNLGNTMDGHTGFTPNETMWQSVETTKELIKAVHDYGFNTVRVPVTWGTMIDDKNGYIINDAWISRVQDIVDYCISQDMFVIINIHHDGAEQSGWLRVASDDIASVYIKFEGVWRNIAERFKHYDEHLIFESMNEVTGDDGTDKGIIKDTQIIMEMNQIFVDTVRATGSNNNCRWLSVPGRYTNIEKMTDAKYGFNMPEDTIEKRLFASVHYYDYTFGMVETLGITMYSYDQVKALARSIERLKERFTSKGIPVILGEYGCINKDNTVERAYHVEAFTRMCRENGIVACYWDQGWYDRSLEPDYSFTLIDRTTLQSIEPAVTDAIMRGTYLSALADDYSDIIKDTQVTAITDISISEEEVILMLGEKRQLTESVLPTGTNDVVLWKTQDEAVATVFRGNIRARGIGTTTVTAYSQSGSVEKQVKVIVLAREMAEVSIRTEMEEFELQKGKYMFLKATLEPAVAGASMTYKSSEEGVASVSVLGKVTAKSKGIAYITITASSGITKTVKIVVKENDASSQLTLAINVYYNDNTHQYYSNEVGESITISGDGQYTLAFDSSEHLSETAVAAGVTGLNNLTAVYIKDYDVTTGLTRKSPLESADIFYDKITVDGVGLTISQTEPKSAIKATGVFDTNDPLNSWDGSVVEEVTVTDHVLNLTTVENPRRIEVTFTISGLTFINGEASAVKEATTLEAVSKETIVLAAAGDTFDISAIIAPNDAGSKITFVSSDESVAFVDVTAVTADITSGSASNTVTAIADGLATITAITDNGLTAEFMITVGIVPEVINNDTTADTTTDTDKGTSEEAIDTTKGSKTEDTKTEDNRKKASAIVLLVIVGTVCILTIGIVVYTFLRKKKDVK